MFIDAITPSVIVQALVTAFTMGITYMGIRKDLTYLTEKAVDAKLSATRAHERIDQHINDHHTSK